MSEEKSFPNFFIYLGKPFFCTVLACAAKQIQAKQTDTGQTVEDHIVDEKVDLISTTLQLIAEKLRIRDVSLYSHVYR